MDHVWQVPKTERSSFSFSIARSFGIIILIGIGFILTGLLSSYGAGIGSNILLKITAFVISLVITFLVLQLVFKLSISPAKSFKQLLLGSIIAAFALETVQSAAGFIIANELKHFSSLYGSLAIVFVVLFWIYLQVRIVLYATEIDSVVNFKLWPRSLTGFRLTAADRRALVLYARREEMAPSGSEEIDVKFNTTKSSKK